MNVSADLLKLKLFFWFNLQGFVVAGFGSGVRRANCGGEHRRWDVRHRGSFLLHLPAAERRALHLLPLSFRRWPGPVTTRSKDFRRLSCYLSSISQSCWTTSLRNIWHFGRELWYFCAINTYMAAGLADSADGETVGSRSAVWPRISAGPSRRSARGSRGDEKSPVGDSQDTSPLLA